MLPEDGFALTEMRLREPAHPPVRLAKFRETMGSMAATVSVVTTSHAHETIGRTVTAALSLGATPPSVLVSIDITARLADLILMSRSFSMAMLAQGQEQVADAFAGKFGSDGRFTYGEWGTWPSGNPMLMGAVATLDCELIGSIETGTHVLFAGAIVHSELSPLEPLIWHRHRYRTLTDQA